MAALSQESKDRIEKIQRDGVAEANLKAFQNKEHDSDDFWDGWDVGDINMLESDHFDDGEHVGQKWRVQLLYCQTLRNRSKSHNMSRQQFLNYQE